MYERMCHDVSTGVDNLARASLISAPVYRALAVFFAQVICFHPSPLLRPTQLCCVYLYLRGNMQLTQSIPNPALLPVQDPANGSTVPIHQSCEQKIVSTRVFFISVFALASILPSHFISLQSLVVLYTLHSTCMMHNDSKLMPTLLYCNY